MPALMTTVDPDSRLLTPFSKISVGDLGHQNGPTCFRLADREGSDQMRSRTTHRFQVVSHAFKIEIFLDV